MQFSRVRKRSCTGKSSFTISAKPVGVGAASQPWIVAGERPFSARCYSLISLSVPSSAARLAAARFAASRCPNGCFRRSSSRDPEAHPASRQIANRSCPLVGVGGNRGLREKHPTEPHWSDLAFAVHFGTRIGNDACEMLRNLRIARTKCAFRLHSE